MRILLQKVPVKHENYIWREYYMRGTSGYLLLKTVMVPSKGKCTLSTQCCGILLLNLMKYFTFLVQLLLQHLYSTIMKLFVLLIVSFINIA